MRIIVPLFVLIGAFIAVDKGFGFLADRHAAKREQMLTAAHEMYSVGQDVLANKTVSGSSSTKLGRLVQGAAREAQKLERDFEAKYTPLYTLLTKEGWAEDEPGVRKAVALSKTWANEGMKVWQKEYDLQQQLLKDLAVELKLRPNDRSLISMKHKSIKFFALYKRMVDKDGRRYFDAFGKYVTFVSKHRRNMKETSEGKFWTDPKIHAQGLKLSDTFEETADAFAKSAEAFEQQQARMREDSARS